MIPQRQLAARLLDAASPNDIRRALASIDCGLFFWQHRRAECLRTWDGFPPGFLEHYYGTDADRFCSVASAIRTGWRSFTFSEARRCFTGRKEVTEASRVWDAFGIDDGIVLTGGAGRRHSTLVIGLSQPAHPLFERYREILSFATARLDGMLLDHKGLNEIPRRFFPVSDKQREVLRIQVENPELNLSEQAKLLGISLRMLEKRHAQIAERFGVSRFAGAVAIASKDPSTIEPTEPA